MFFYPKSRPVSIVLWDSKLYSMMIRSLNFTLCSDILNFIIIWICGYRWKNCNIIQHRSRVWVTLEGRLAPLSHFPHLSRRLSHLHISSLEIFLNQLPLLRTYLLQVQFELLAHWTLSYKLRHFDNILQRQALYFRRQLSFLRNR